MLGGERTTSALQIVDRGAKFEYFQRTFGPVVNPADDEIRATGIVPVVAKVAAAILEFDSDALPPVVSDVALSLAIWEIPLHGFDDEAELVTQNAKKVDDSLLVYRCVPETSEIEGGPELRATGLRPSRGTFAGA